MNKSVILPAFFRGSIKDIHSFKQAVNAVKEYDISTVEFYHEGSEITEIKEILGRSKLNSVYLGAMAAKRHGLNLSSLDEEKRINSLRVIKRCVEEAYFYGSKALLINSGPRPGESTKNFEAYQILKKSITEILDYSKEYSGNYLLKIILEPGDTEVDSYELIGKTELAVKLCQDIKEENFELTLDTSHLRQLNENPLESIKKRLNTVPISIWLIVCLETGHQSYMVTSTQILEWKVGNLLVLI